MIEVEIKVRIPDTGSYTGADIEKRLGEMGAEFLGVETHTDTYYNAPHRDFSKSDEALRVRCLDTKDGSVDILTYKGQKIDFESKTRKEIEIKIDNAKKADEILKELGFIASGGVVKTRKNYKLKDIYVSLDDVNWLGKFMELEITVEGKDFDYEKKKIFEVLPSLGFKKGDVIRESYLEMLKEIRKA